METIIEYIQEMNRMNMMYIPVEQDKIDSLLGDMISKGGKDHGDNLSRSKLLFVRESEGVYTYCKKKVFMKNEQDKLIIRVGGGFMSLDEFVENFNPIQLLKNKAIISLKQSLMTNPNISIS